MILEDKYLISKDKQNCTNFVLKVLPQYLELKDRKKLKEQIIEIKLLAQVNDNNIPDFKNEDYIYQTIMLIEFKVISIDKTLTFIETLHKLFKAPTVIKLTDIRENYVYSFSKKRLSKLKEDDIVVEDMVTTKILSNVINTNTSQEYGKVLTNHLNKNNKYEYYFEMLLKTYIFKNKGNLDKEAYNNLINSNMYYDIYKMENMYYNLNSYMILKEKYKNCTSIADKIELKKEIDEISRKI